MTRLETMARQVRAQRAAVAGAIEVPQFATGAGLARQARAQMALTTAVSKAKIARLQFADWLQSNMPQVFQGAAEAASAHESAQAALFEAKKATLGELGISWGGFTDFFVEPVIETTAPIATATKSTWQSFLDGAIAAGTAYLSLENQKDMLALNIERAKSGLPPLDPGLTAPVIKTQIDIDPALARSLMSDVGSTINRNMLVIAAVGLAAIFFLGRK